MERAWLYLSLVSLPCPAMAVGNSAASSAGASVLSASSTARPHEGSCAIDGDPRTFWLSTGLLPQLLTIQLAETSHISSITLRTAHGPPHHPRHTTRTLPLHSAPAPHTRTPHTLTHSDGSPLMRMWLCCALHYVAQFDAGRC